MTTLTTAPLAPLLDRLFAEADAATSPALSALSGEERDAMAATTGALARFLGYDASRGDALEPLDADRLLLSGTALAQRRRRVGKDIDWRPPKRRAEDRPLRPPAPRKRSRGAADLDRVTFRQLAAHRLRREG